MLQYMRSFKRPVGMPEQLSGQQDKVSLPGADHMICLLRRRDEPNSPCGSCCSPAHTFRKAGLITRANGDGCLCKVAAGTHVQQIHACLSEEGAKANRFIDSPAQIFRIGPVLEFQPIRS